MFKRVTKLLFKNQSLYDILKYIFSTGTAVECHIIGSNEISCPSTLPLIAGVF